MIFDLSWQELLVDGLACFRLSVLLADDTGPWHAFSKLRAWLKREEKHSPTLRKAHAAEGVECKRCNSLWLAAPISAWALLGHGPTWLILCTDVFLLAMALSAVAIIMNRAWPKR